jgi:pilus assembly protein CpaE
MSRTNDEAASAATSPLNGRRVLLVGPALDLAVGDALKGAATQTVAIDRLSQASAGLYDLVLIDADAWEAPVLAAAVEALAASERAAPVLLIGQRLPTVVVRNLMRLPNSDVLDAPFSVDQFVAAAGVLLATAQPAPTPVVAPAGGSRCWAAPSAARAPPRSPSKSQRRWRPAPARTRASA